MHSSRDISALLHAHNIRPSRRFGQNFVTDPNTVRRIVRLADVTAGDHVIEIGPGLGSLTLALAESGAQLTAIETDAKIVPILRDVLQKNTVTCRVMHADALHVDWDEVVQRDRRNVVVANLPYNVGTAITTQLLEHVPAITRFVLLLQKEVVQRMIALPRTKEYGVLSVVVQYFAAPCLLGEVPRTVFAPQPDVDSALVALDRRGVLPLVSTDPTPTPTPTPTFSDMMRVVHAGFGQRRKMLRSSLRGIASAEAFAEACISPMARAEELSVEEWCVLSRATVAYPA